MQLVPGINAEPTLGGLSVDTSRAVERRFIIDGIDRMDAIASVQGQFVRVDNVDEVQNHAEQPRGRIRWLARNDDPSSPLANAVVANHMVFARQYDEAVAEARRVFERFPDLIGMHDVIGDALWYQGRYEEALAELKATFGDGQGWQAFESGFRRGGPRAAYSAYCAYLAGLTPAQQPNPYNMAACYAEAGDRDTTFAWLEKAYAARLPQLLHVTAEPGFDSVRDDPRYADLLHRIGIPGN